MRLSPIRLAACTTAAGCLSLAMWSAAAGASQSAGQIVNSAVAATESATSVRVVVSLVQNHQKESFNVQATNSGVGQGSITQGNQSFTFRSVGGTVYLMANTAFWKAQGGKSAVQLLAGKWVSTAATSSTGSSLAEFLNSTTLLKQFFNTTGVSSSVFVTPRKGSVGGHPATVISGHDKSGGGKIYIAASGSPYILRVTFSDKTTAGTVTLSNFNQPVNPAVPPNPVDLDTLPGASS
jgi:hypothetical protein